MLKNRFQATFPYLRQSHRNARRYSFPAIVLLAAIAASFPANVARAQTDADFSAFCRENFPGSVYQRFSQSWGAEHVCNQGGTRQGIDFAEACRLTTGNTGHRVMGTRVICDGAAGGPGPAPTGNAGPVDLAAYCRTEFPNSIYEKRFEPTGIEHYCRRPGATGGDYHIGGAAMNALRKIRTDSADQ